MLSRDFNNYVHLDSAGDTTIKIGRGTLKRIVLNETITGDVTVYDGVVSGTDEIAVIADGTGHIDYDLVFTNGLTINNGASQSITVVYSE